MTEQWVKQQREVDSYNLFFSSFDGLSGAESLYDLGYRLVGSFVTIRDTRQQLIAEPDFVLFNGETALLVEVKSGENINERDKQQMERCNGISYETIVDFLRDAEFNDRGLDPNELNNVESVIVYYTDFIEDCRSSTGCSSALDDLKQHSAVLSQQKGESLTLAEGTLEDNELKTLLRNGIRLPMLVDKKVYLTENTNREILAYSIAHDLVLNNLGKDDRLSITPSDVIERYRHREVPLEKVTDALQFLEKIGGCQQNSAGSYQFDRHRVGKLMQVQSKLEDARVAEFLESGQTKGQSSLEDFGSAETDGGA
ncbi:hypothetical protein C5C07_19195 [Haloferax sp. Atlit-4N]|uniref:hypothetical protein n=1 Tax=Haloferax sp. Atlit-4N TaxID=2077206 RepID=UPI000E231AA1|nr:hypothetical protein [Haloferax sp. Atlit-4N]RDZ50450.1 hypothetical protein C5C07_19195 [Haloferax sp. Atlit-4N]